MLSYFEVKYGNPSEPHDWGVAAKKAVNKARKQVAAVLGAKPDEIVFTSCATESINYSHKGLVENLLKAGKKLHLITTAIEHKAVLETVGHLQRQKKVEVSYLPVDKYGLVSLVDLNKAIKPETVLVSIMYVNNETGTIEPIREIGKLLEQINQERKIKGLGKIYFHTDATQAIQYLDCNVKKLGVDLLSLTAHKFYGPKGIGALYVKKGVVLDKLIDGGSQENGFRAGTENVPYIVGLGKAIALAQKSRQKEKVRLTKLRDKLINGILTIPRVQLTGHLFLRAPHIASFVIKGAEGEALLLHLNNKKIAVSSGSACASRTLSPSYVLLAMGIKPEIAHGSLRFSLGKWTQEKDINYVVNILPGIISKLRKMNPLYHND